MSGGGNHELSDSQLTIMAAWTPLSARPLFLFKLLFEMNESSIRMI